MDVIKNFSEEIGCLFGKMWIVKECEEVLEEPFVKACLIAAFTGVGVFAVVPFLFVQPAAAVGKSVTFMGSLRAIKGNKCRLFIVYMVTLLQEMITYIPLDY